MECVRMVRGVSEESEGCVNGVCENGEGSE